MNQTELRSLGSRAGIGAPDLTSKFNQFGLTDKDVSFENFLKAVSSIRLEKNGYQGERDASKIVLHGHSNENTTHTINVDEKESFTMHLNQALGHDKDVASRLPIDPKSMGLFSECRGIYFVIQMEFYWQNSSTTQLVELLMSVFSTWAQARNSMHSR